MRKYDPKIHRRQSMRLMEYDYSQAGAYFVTICVREGEPLFGEIVNGVVQLSDFGRVVMECWKAVPEHFQDVELDEFVVMPNHVHGIIVISAVGTIHELSLQNDPRSRRRMLLPKVVGYLKMNTAKRINEIRETPGTPVWQRNYYEHIIRHDDEMKQLRNYIANNPIGWESDKYHPTHAKKIGG